MGNMHKKFGKDLMSGPADILSDRQTGMQTHRQTHLSQYFTTAPAGEVLTFRK